MKKATSPFNELVAFLQIAYLDYMKKIFRMFSWSSLKGEILTAFIVTAVIPSLIITIFSYVSTYNIVQDNATHVIPTKKAGEFAADTYYLFHLGHRIIDYQMWINS